MAGHCAFAMLSQSIVELTVINIWRDIANSQCYHNPVSSLQQEIYGKTLGIRNVITIQCRAYSKKYTADIANAQCYHNPVSSLQQEIYGRTLRIRNVITIRCRAYSKEYMVGHCEFAMSSQSNFKLAARNIWQDIGNSQCYHNTVSSLQQEIYGGHCEFAMLSRSSVELTAMNIWQDTANM